jgi:hypothetical protein
MRGTQHRLEPAAGMANAQAKVLVEQGRCVHEELA